MIDNERLYQVVGSRLRKLREEFDMASGRMTQAELASIVGLERTSITNIEKGVQKVSLHVLYGICDALHAKVTDVLPAADDVAREPELPPQRTELQFGGVTIPVPPRALQRITAILEKGASDEAPQS